MLGKQKIFLGPAFQRIEMKIVFQVYSSSVSEKNFTAITLILNPYFLLHSLPEKILGIYKILDICENIRSLQKIFGICKNIWNL